MLGSSLLQYLPEGQYSPFETLSITELLFHRVLVQLISACTSLVFDKCISPFHPLPAAPENILRSALCCATLHYNNLLGECRTLWGRREEATHYSIDCYVAKALLPVKYPITAHRPFIHGM